MCVLSRLSSSSPPLPLVSPATAYPLASEAKTATVAPAVAAAAGVVGGGSACDHLLQGKRPQEK